MLQHLVMQETTPEDMLRKRAQLLHQKQRQLESMNPFGDGTLVGDESYCIEVERLRHEIAELQNWLIRSKNILVH